MAANEFKKILQNESKNKIISDFYEFLIKFNTKLIDDNENCYFDEYEKNLGLIYKNPFLINDQITEFTKTTDLLKTCANLHLNKIIYVLVEIIDEITILSNDSVNKFIYPISTYDLNLHLSESNFFKNSLDVDLEDFSIFINILFDLLCFLQRCNNVGFILISQLKIIFLKKDQKQFSDLDLNNVRFDLVLESFQQLLICILNIEEVLNSNQKFKKDFYLYKQFLQFVSLNPEKFDLNKNKINKLELFLLLINKLQQDVIDKSFFQNFCQELNNSINDSSDSQINNQFINYFSTYIKYRLIEFENIRFILDHKWLGICCLFVVYTQIFNKVDHKLCKLIFETQKRLDLYIIHLEGNVSIFPDKFLNKFLDKSMIDLRLINFFNIQREKLIRINLNNIFKEHSKNLIEWLLIFNNLVNDRPEFENHNISYLHSQIKNFEKGLKIAKQIYSTIKNCVQLHLLHNKPISKSEIILVCRLTNLLKAIELAFLDNKSIILLIIIRYSRYCSYLMLLLLSKLHKKLILELDHYNEKKLDLLSTIILSCNCAQGPILNRKRQTIINLCISILKSAISEQDSSELKLFFRRILFISNIYEDLNYLTNSNFIYFNISIVDIYFKHCSEKNNLASELAYFFYSLNDSFKLIYDNQYLDKAKSNLICKNFQSIILQSFENNFLNRFFCEYENELRLQVHNHLNLEEKNVFKEKLNNFSLIFKLSLIPVFDKFVSVQHHLENYLSEVTYTLTAITLHDWRTYESMLNLARNQYNFHFISSQLPIQNLEQGLDILEIIRNIQKFVCDYYYNLNNQMFIQRPIEEERYVNILKIKHVANSLRTHGYGILNTAVNQIYKFLKTKFNLFSQFLFQEKISSKLIKEIRLYKESNESKFSFENGKKILRIFQKLRTTNQDSTYIDEFEMLITKIGNVLAFVRLLRSGFLHCSSNLMKFVPDLEELNELNFEKLAQNDNLSEETISAATNLDENLAIIKQSFLESTDYFKLIVQVFKNSINCDKNLHLKNFYMILPALTINHVEKMILRKEKLLKKNESGATFTDDGLAMGVAYILRLLDQNQDFENLQWFNSVSEEINVKLENSVEKKTLFTNRNNDKKLLQTNILKVKKLKSFLQEFNLFEYNLGSCMILFNKTC